MTSSAKPVARNVFLDGLERLSTRDAPLQRVLQDLRQLTQDPEHRPIPALAGGLSQVRRDLSGLHVGTKRVVNQLEQLQGLVRVSAVISSSLDFDRVLEEEMDNAIELTNAERAFLMLRAEGRDELELRDARNWDRASLAEQEVAFSREVMAQMGAGGMGVVYAAQDTQLGRHVALEFLPEAAWHDQGARARLLAEARVAACLDHPNIGVVHAMEDAEGHPFIVMALYEGESLPSRIDRAPMAPQEAADVAGQVARGLARAHQQGVVHRDVKPDNLFLAASDPVKILDSGLATLDRMDALAGPGSLVGTLEHMSPEQIRGQAVDERTDL